MSIQIGKQAPDFSAEACLKGQAVQVSLSGYRGGWVLLFFYPADFTFV
jgi:peroxiredoxin (alkyl hydroperoxide reductase subunit C)